MGSDRRSQSRAIGSDGRTEDYFSGRNLSYSHERPGGWWYCVRCGDRDVRATNAGPIESRGCNHRDSANNWTCAYVPPELA